MNPIKSRFQTPLLALLLFAANVYLCRELFRTEYLNQLGSIEAAFIAIARYAAENLSDLAWFPLWYDGIPYQNTYPPLLHLTVAAASRISGASPALSYHAVTAFLYCLAPVTLFALCLRLSGSRAASFAAGVFYSFVSPSAFLMAGIHNELGGYWRPRRLQILLAYGEGPHIAGLALLPLAILLLDVAVKRRNPLWTFLAAIAFAATVLTNWLAAAALAAAVLAYLLAARTGWVRTAIVATLAYCLAAPWIPPSTIRVIQFNAQTIEGDYSHVFRTLPLYAAVLAAALALLAFALRRTSVILQWAAAFTLMMSAIALSWAWWGAVLLPQPHRYHAEMELGFAVLVPFAIAIPFVRLPVRARWMIAALALVAIVPAAKSERRFARVLLAPVDIAHTVEYRMSRWFGANMQGRRVMAPGSVSFWLNAFANTPQIGGGFDQGATNFLNRILTYVLYTSDSTGDHDAEISGLWLQAFGVQAIGIGGPKSREYYKPWRRPDKFAGSYQELWRDGDDVVYAVPQRTPSLAHVITRAGLAPRPPINGIDVDPLRPYVAALNNPAFPPADMRWTTRHSAEITAPLESGQVFSVQMNWHPGWHASRGTIQADSLGLIILDPQCSGPCSVELTYDGGTEMKVVRWVRWAAVLAWIVWFGLWRFRPRKAA